VLTHSEYTLLKKYITLFDKNYYVNDECLRNQIVRIVNKYKFSTFGDLRTAKKNYQQALFKKIQEL